MYQRYLKRLLDVIFASAFVILLIIPFALIAVWIKIDSKSTVFFKQKRAGKNLKPFMVYKFRTMTTDAPKNCPTKSLNNANVYITRSGEIMRKLSIDELPQLINVLKGEMSIVGPRPVILFETDLLLEREKYGANSCKPGITGWSQVHGRDKLCTIDKAKMDGGYVKNFGIIMDVKCVFMSVWTVLSRNGYNEGVVNSVIKQPRITTNPQNVFYAKVPSQTGRTQKRSVLRRKDRTKFKKNS